MRRSPRGQGSWLGAVFAALTLAAPASAETASSNSIHAGAVSVQYLAFGGSSKFSGSTRSGVFVKAHFSDRGAVRLGASLSLDESTGKRPAQLPAEVGNTRDYEIYVWSEVQVFLDARGPVTTFVSLGPYWGKSRRMYEETYYALAPDSTERSSHYQDEERSWEAGVTAATGFEWFFRRRISVIGRLGAGIGYTKQHQTYIRSYDDASSQRQRFDFSSTFSGTSSAALGLSAYF